MNHAPNSHQDALFLMAGVGADELPSLPKPPASMRMRAFPEEETRAFPKVMIAYGSRIWVNLLQHWNPSMKVVGLHDGFVVVRYRGRVWKVIGGGPRFPTIREVYRHDFTRPA